MNDTQLENWRRVLIGVVGPWAMFMPKEQIIALRDRLQSRVDAQQGARVVEFCSCDPEKQGKTIHVDGGVTCNKCSKTRR